MQMTIDALLPAYLDSMGYDVNKNGQGADYTPTYSAGGKLKPKGGGTLYNNGSGLWHGAKPSSGTSSTGTTSSGTTFSRGGGGLQYNGSVNNNSFSQNSGGGKWSIQKKPPQDVIDAMQKYGQNSKEYYDAYNSWKNSESEKLKSQRDIEQLTLDNTEKFLKGDFTLNPGQKQFLDKAFAPIKDASLQAIKYLKDEANNLEGNLGKAIDGFKGEVAKTGLGMGDAIALLENRIKQTGANMKSALDEEVSTTRKLNEMGLKDFTLDQRLKIQNQAVSLGRSSTDPDFQLAMQENVNKEIERSNLMLGQYAADKNIAIAERTGAGLEDAAKLRMGVAERTGQGMEDASKMKMDAALQAENLRMQAAQMQGQTDIGLAENKANVWRDLVMGLPSTQIGTGINVGQYQNALLQQRIQNAGAAMGAPLNIYNTLAANRYAQPTTTNTQKSSPSAMSIISGLIGTGLSGVGAAYGMGLFGHGGGGGGGGGGAA